MLEMVAFSGRMLDIQSSLIVKSKNIRYPGRSGFMTCNDLDGLNTSLLLIGNLVYLGVHLFRDTKLELELFSRDRKRAFSMIVRNINDKEVMDTTYLAHGGGTARSGKNKKQSLSKAMHGEVGWV